MGLNGWQRFWQIEFPLALPMLLAGIRLVALPSIGIGTIVAFINAGGLGVLLFQGVITANYGKIFTGALAVTVLSFAANYFIRYLERGLNLEFMEREFENRKLEKTIFSRKRKYPLIFLGLNQGIFVLWLFVVTNHALSE